jgi:hypothetical protein
LKIVSQINWRESSGLILYGSDPDPDPDPDRDLDLECDPDLIWIIIWVVKYFTMGQGVYFTMILNDP